MEPSKLDNTVRRENVRRYFEGVAKDRKLPALPVVAAKILDMIQDPNINVQKLSRVLSDDPALAERVLAVSRSPLYAQRKLPATSVDAVQVLGLRTLASVVIANAMHGLQVKNHPTYQKLWNHSVAVALAARILCKRIGSRDRDQAFLAGLMHDIGQMIFLYGDPAGFNHLCADLRRLPGPITAKEEAAYDCDHALIGLTLLDSWNIDSEIGLAIVNHHSESAAEDRNELAVILTVADYLCARADLGFMVEPEAPTTAMLAQCRLESEESLAALVQEIFQAFQQENALFQPS